MQGKLNKEEEALDMMEIQISKQKTLKVHLA